MCTDQCKDMIDQAVKYMEKNVDDYKQMVNMLKIAYALAPEEDQQVINEMGALITEVHNGIVTTLACALSTEEGHC